MIMGEHCKETWCAITGLYCQNKIKKKNTCENRECGFEKCLCIDDEQVILVTSLMDHSFLWKLDDINGKFVGEEAFDNDFFCPDQYCYKKRLIKCKEVSEESLVEYVNEHIKNGDEVAVFDIIKSLPVIQCINMIEKINIRDSICYLCLFSIAAQDYFKGLLLSYTRQMLNCYLNNEDISKLKAVFENIVIKIEEIFYSAHFDDFASKYTSVIFQYVKAFEAQKDFALTHFSKKLYDFLMEMKKIPENYKDSSKAFDYIFDKNEGGQSECIRLFELSKKVLNLFDDKFSDRCHSFFETTKHFEVTKHNLYDGFSMIIDSFPTYREDTKRDILKQMLEQLNEYS